MLNESLSKLDQQNDKQINLSENLGSDLHCLPAEVSAENNEIISQIVSENLTTFCKKLCANNCVKYQCTLDNNLKIVESDKLLCEWGNGSYDWMVGELHQIQHQNDLKNRKIYFKDRYFRKIIHSVPFWERYKNWRFQRRIRVPEYIKALDPDASVVFWRLYDKDSIENIAQQLCRHTSEIKNLVKQIYAELVLRKRSHMLEQVVNYSLHGDYVQFDNGNTYPLSFQPSVDNVDIHHSVLTAYQQLDWQEQYILDVMVIDNLSATAVLKVLKEQSIRLDDKTDVQDLNIQHVYYFLRKTILKLKQKSNLTGGNQ